MFRNPPGKMGYVRYAPGPDKLPGGSYQFYGRPDSFIEFPNRGKLDTRKSITILAWIYPEGSAGPIFNYMPNGWGVHLWMVSSNTLFVRYTRRQGRTMTAPLSSRRMTSRKWQYIAATYDYITGIAKLYLDSKVIAQRRLGRMRLATNYPVRMGAKIGDRRYFRGRISCVMVFDSALNPNQIARRKKRCFRRKFVCWLLFMLTLCLESLTLFPLFTGLIFFTSISLSALSGSFTHFFVHLYLTKCSLTFVTNLVNQPTSIAELSLL